MYMYVHSVIKMDCCISKINKKSSQMFLGCSKLRLTTQAPTCDPAIKSNGDHKNALHGNFVKLYEVSLA